MRTIADMDLEDSAASAVCPACGGAGGGPFGRAGSGWDREDYVCARCKGVGSLTVEAAATPRPGIAKTTPPVARPAKKIAGKR